MVDIGAGTTDVAIFTNGATADAYAGTPVEKWGEKEWQQFGIESRRWTLSQFLHGEQGALICTAKIVETVPWYDAKLYASTQVVDEARHVEVFARYLEEKLGGEYQINVHLRMLLDDIINDSRWDMTYLGMQIMVEGLALAAFGFMQQMTTEPLLKKLLRYVMSDEARHVAFGVLSLQDFYTELDSKEIRERQEFAYEAAVRMRDRFLQQEVWERMGINTRDDRLETDNVAAVVVTAVMPPFSRNGARIDLNVSSLGNAKSLQGGSLLVTPLMGADGEVYAAAAANHPALYASVDQGRTWSLIQTFEGGPGAACDGLYVDPKNKNRIFAGVWNNSRILLS